jgi:hypothetical protein
MKIYFALKKRERYLGVLFEDCFSALHAIASVIIEATIKTTMLTPLDTLKETIRAKIQTAIVTSVGMTSCLSYQLSSV